MRFLMINLLLVCLLLFGIGYLAFGDDETVAPAEPRHPHTEEKPWEASFEHFDNEDTAVAGLSA